PDLHDSTYNIHTPTTTTRSSSLLLPPFLPIYSFFFFNDPATTEIYTLSLHDALPISCRQVFPVQAHHDHANPLVHHDVAERGKRSEEHTSELQSRSDLVCRLLLEKKKIKSPRYMASSLVGSHNEVCVRYLFYSLYSVL